MRGKPIPKERKCNRCGIVKSIQQFHRHARVYFQYNCKSCQAELHKVYYKENSERYRAWKKRYYQINREEILNKAKIYSFRRREKIKDWRQKYRDWKKPKLQKIQIILL